MPAPGSYPIDISDMKYSLLTADSGTSGPTYSAAVDMDGSLELTLQFPAGDTRELRGDGAVKQRSVAAGAVTFQGRIGGVQLAVLNALFGHVVVASGTTPNARNRLTYLTAPTKPYFKLQGMALNNDGGSTRITIYKAQLDNNFVEISLNDGDFATATLTGTAYPTTSTTVVNAVARNLVFDIDQDETALANAAAA